MKIIIIIIITHTSVPFVYKNSTREEKMLSRDVRTKASFPTIDMSK